VMPEDADPAAIMQLTAQHGEMAAPQLDPRVPRNIQPYQPDLRPAMASTPHLTSGFSGGPVIAPYQPAPSGPGNFRAGAYNQPAGLPNLPSGGLQFGGRWSPGGFTPAAALASSSPATASSTAPSSLALSSSVKANSSAAAAAKGLVSRVAKGEVLASPETAKRLASQCAAAKISASQLGDVISRMANSLYLGLEPEGCGSAIGDTDAALARLLNLTDVLFCHGTEFASEAALAVKDSAAEELSSVRSSAQHKDEAEVLLARLGLLNEDVQIETTKVSRGDVGVEASRHQREPSHNAPSMHEDLLGDVAQPASQSAAPQVDLLGGGETVVAPVRAPSNAAMADLLGSDDEDASAASAAATAVDAELAELLGDTAAAAPTFQPVAAATDLATAPCSNADLLSVGSNTEEESVDLLGTHAAPATSASLSLDPLAPGTASATAGVQAAPSKSVPLLEGLELGGASGNEDAPALVGLPAQADHALQAVRKPGDAFSFVGEEILRAKGEA